MATVIQGFVSTGGASGEFVTPSLQPIDLKGWSTFIKLKPFDNFPIAQINRFDEIINRDHHSWIERQAID